MNARTRRLRRRSRYTMPTDKTDWCLAIIGTGLAVIAACFAIIQVTTGVAT